jgi:hypothetical protein
MRTDRQTDRQTRGQSGSQTGRQRDRQTDWRRRPIGMSENAAVSQMEPEIHPLIIGLISAKVDVTAESDTSYISNDCQISVAFREILKRVLRIFFKHQSKMVTFLTNVQK